jgi:hypothetical protein
MIVLERLMATPVPRRRKSADAAISPTVKSSLHVSRELHSRWQAAASIRGMTANAFAVEALTEALRGIVVIDRNRAKPDDRRVQELGISPDDEDEAA